MQSPSKHLFVSVKDQTLAVVESGTVVCVYPVSTSKFGLGSEENSFKTPLGNFQIREMIGAGEPSGTVFKGRVPVGRWELGQPEEEDMILSRILWLDGMEEQNCNTHSRYVYIHGTNDEERIGKPVSHGCVRLRNADVIELFEQLTPGTKVLISETDESGILTA